MSIIKFILKLWQYKCTDCGVEVNQDPPYGVKLCGRCWRERQ